ncbi:MAG: amino acid transporter [Bryobacteraceae bacterium]
MGTSKRARASLRKWLLHELRAPSGPHGKAVHTHPWWQVMCLTGVDYFSTLGYQPGVAFLAAGILSPLATLILVLVTLFAAFPVYSRVAEASPDGQGSISMLERLFPRWKGKALVLCLLGFAATDFIITMTLSAADATSHIIENPFVPAWTHHPVGVTLVLLALLAGVFLKGFREAVGLAVTLVACYLALNLIVVSRALYEVAVHPEYFSRWRNLLEHDYGSVAGMATVALLLFPKLALGLSGFETGVAVMPLVRGDTAERIRGTRKLLLVAALIMSAFLMGSSVATTVLIEPAQFQPGGEAADRALAYLAHRFFGDWFGTAYDISTISILWFAGASAMAGLLNLVPKYLPRYGMAPEWARASRPLVLVFAIIAFLVTWIFDASVKAQSGAYATGVLVLMVSAAIAVTVALRNGALRVAFFAISAVFLYTTVVNVAERPEGIKIASIFIGLTVALSLVSRALRATELRTTTVVLDEKALALLASDDDQLIRVIAHRPDNHSLQEYAVKDRISREAHHLNPSEYVLFLEIERADASDFDAPLHVTGATVGPYRILRAASPAIPNAIAALLIHIGRATGKLPHAYFGWTEGNPIGYLFRYLFFGEGDVAPIAREVLRQKIADPKKRPYIHVT